VQAYLTSKRVKEIGMIALTIKGGTRYKGKRETDPENMYLRQTKYHTSSYNLSYMGGPDLILSPIPGVSRVEDLPVLGFVLSGDLSVGHDLTETPGSCSRSL